MVRWTAIASMAVIAILIVSMAAIRSADASPPARTDGVHSVAVAAHSEPPAPVAVLAGLPVRSSPGPEVHPDVTAYTTILPDGSLAGASAPISQTGNTYDLTASFSGAVIDERNQSTFDGNGYTITSSVALGFAFQVNTTTDVTVEDLAIVDEDHAVEVVNATSTLVTGVNAGATTGGAFTALDSDDVTFGDDGANASDIGFAVNDSLDVSFLHDWASNDLVGYFGLFDSGFDEFDSVANDDGNAFVAAFSESVELLDGSFLSATEEAIEVAEDSDASLLGVTTNDSVVGLFAELDSQLSVADSYFTDAHDYGLEAGYVDDVTVDGSDFDGAGLYGLFLDHGSPAELSDDTANASGISGFDIENVTSGSLTGLTADSDGWNGLWLTDGFGLTVDRSTFDDVTSSTGNGTYLRSSTDVVLSADTFLDDDYGVYDVASHSLEITDSNASLGDVGFVLIEDVDSQVLSDSSFGDSGTALAFDLSSDFRAASNNFSDDYAGIVLTDTLTGVVEGNIIDDAAEFGVLAEFDSGSVIANNVVRDAPDAYYDFAAEGTLFDFDNASDATDVGFYFTTDTGPAVYGSNVSDSGVGFLLDGVVGGNLTGNTFYHDSDDFDIDLSSVASTVVYWNNFIDGGGWFFDATGGTATSIDFANGYPGGGNYWSNWTSPDVEHGPDQNLPGGDGIVDLPFEISGSYVDPYPLTHALNVANLTVVFTAQGLPTGTTWGLAWGSSLSESTNGTSLSVFTGSPAWANYSYAIDAPAGWIASPAAGTIEYEGGLEVVTIVFTPATYPVTFQETGLPNGASWSVNVSGIAYSSTTGTITVPLANGTYSYSVAPIAGYLASPSTGSVVVDAGAPTVSVTFAAVLYPVEFSETGLASGTSWTVTIGGHTSTSITSTLTFHIANGSYHFLIGNISGYSVTPYSGFQAVAGGGASVAVVYSATTSSSSPGSWLTWVLVALVVVLAIAVVALLLRGRRKPEAAPAVASWTPPPAAAATPPPAGAPGAPPPGAVSPPPPDWKET